jgi:hypothetical protein
MFDDDDSSKVGRIVVVEVERQADGDDLQPRQN